MNILLTIFDSLKFNLLHDFPREVARVRSRISNLDCELSLYLLDVLEHPKAYLHLICVVTAGILYVQHYKRLYPVPVVITSVRRPFNT